MDKETYDNMVLRRAEYRKVCANMTDDELMHAIMLFNKQTKGNSLYYGAIHAALDILISRHDAEFASEEMSVAG